MHYLIDGHNLIATMPGIDFSDPDDEAQLVLRLRTWTAASHKRRVTVYFDGGLPGGPAHDLSGARLKVIFASTGRSADDLILNRIGRVKNPPEFTLVSSDREIVSAAEKRKMPTIPSESFARRLEQEAEERARPEPPSAPDEPLLSEDEVAQWMELFGPEPEIPRRPSRKPPRKSAPPSSRQESEKKPRRRPAMRDPRELKDSGESLTEEEVAQWMELFGPEPEEPDQAAPGATSEAAKELRRRRRERRRQKGDPPRPADEMKESGAALTEDEVEEWLDLFTDPDDE